MGTVRPGAAADVGLFRDVRLRALEESPDAFAASLEEELALAEPSWLRRLEPDSGAVFLGLEGERGVGMAGIFLRPDEGASAQIWGMWVDPALRGGGLARQLLDAALDWAGARGAATAELWVVGVNGRAVHFYEKAGFGDTGDRQSQPRRPGLVERRLLRRLR